ncbi:cyclase family protein [Rubrobacter marinus]|uniref:Kynurenine formamidase n=2 Tax=Rubrobacter marinus TaxID=2653852 RepID=A0A6G8Q2D0_9ACTN|nr:cyclase family protein [Rubrobacter marinus]
MVRWPDNPPVEIERTLDMERGDVANVSRLSFGSHTGTHMDAPLHFVRGGDGLDLMPLDATVGTARVIGIEDPVSVKREEIEPHGIGRGERVLFRTRNSARRWWTEDFMEDFVYVSEGAALYLAEREVRTVGVDYLSVGGFHEDGVETHEALLGAGIWVIEGLELSGVEPGGYELVCLPLKVANGDGAPARAILRKLEET